MSRRFAIYAVLSVFCYLSAFRGDAAQAQVAERPAPQTDSRPKMNRKTALFFQKWAQSYQQAKTLQYTAVTTIAPRKQGAEPKRITLRIWAKRPNLLRAEVETDDPAEHATLVSDGTIILEYAPAMNQYMKTPMPDGPLLIQGELAGLRYLSPTLFFHPKPEQALTYGLVSANIRANETWEGEMCTVLVRQFPQTVSIVWGSDKDYLPRFSVSFSMRGSAPVELSREERRNVRVDAPIPDTLFKLTIPKKATQVLSPAAEDRLLKPGTLAPDFSAKDTGNKNVRLSSLRGRPVMLMFWSNWCPTCQTELAALETLQKEFADRGLVVVALNSWDFPNATQEYLAKHADSRLTFWRDSQEERADSIAMKHYGVQGIPATYLIGSDGKVVRAWIAYDDKKPEELRDALAKLPVVRNEK